MRERAEVAAAQAAAAEVALISGEPMVVVNDTDDEIEIVEVVQAQQIQGQLLHGFQFRTITIEALPMAGPAPQAAAASQPGVRRRRFIPFVDLVDEDNVWRTCDECVLCLDLPPTVKVQICGHIVYCKGCAVRVRDEGGPNLQRCPMCQASSLDAKQKLLLEDE